MNIHIQHSYAHAYTHTITHAYLNIQMKMIPYPNEGNAGTLTHTTC